MRERHGKGKVDRTRGAGRRCQEQRSGISDKERESFYYVEGEGSKDNLLGLGREPARALTPCF